MSLVFYYTGSGGIYICIVLNERDLKIQVIQVGCYGIRCFYEQFSNFFIAAILNENSWRRVHKLRKQSPNF
jgi:hypothetical protein